MTHVTTNNSTNKKRHIKQTHLQDMQSNPPHKKRKIDINDNKQENENKLEHKETDEQYFKIHIKKSIKISQNHKCITLELTTKDIDYSYKLTNNELPHVKHRKDNTKFIIYCSNCLSVGHASNKCNNRYKICVAGDSHTAYWGCANSHYINTDVVRIRIPGMSAQGLKNANSHLKSSNKIVSAFKNCHNGNTGYLFIQIGQVDIDYVWYFRQMKYKNTLNFDDQINKSINNLFAFLNDQIINNKNVKIIIHGVHLPPLNNENMKQKLYDHFINRANLTKEYLDETLVLPSHKQRTQMALKFNIVLKDKCEKFGCLFVEVSSEIIDENTGIVEDKFVKKNEIDIHLNPKALIPIYDKKFKEMKLDFALEIDAIWNKLHLFENELKHRFKQ
eukprot:179471_1